MPPPPEGTNSKGVNDLIDFDGGFVSFSLFLWMNRQQARGRSFLKIDNFEKSGCNRREGKGRDDLPKNEFNNPPAFEMKIEKYFPP